MWELFGGIRALRDPGQSAQHVPWLNEIRGQLSDLDLLPLLAMVPSRGYMPDFLTPPPASPLARFEDELDTFRRTPAAQVRKDLERFARGHGRLPEPVRPLAENPRRELPRLARTVEAFWHRAMEQHWPRLLGLLAADLRYRATRLTQGGPAALFADLDPHVQFDGARLTVGTQWQGEVELRGSGLLLVPAAFHWRRPGIISAAPWQPTLIYPARGVGLLWEPAPEATPELGGLIGTTRARLLASLDAPRSTTELAQLLELTPGGVSQHLAALSAAAVVHRRRQGRVVLYGRTTLGDALLSGSVPATQGGSDPGGSSVPATQGGLTPAARAYPRHKGV